MNAFVLIRACAVGISGRKSPRETLFRAWLPEGIVPVILLALASVGHAEFPPTFLQDWGTSGTGDGQFNRPFGVATDPIGNVYVVDQGNRRVQKFSETGVFLAKWGSLGSGNGQFQFPLGIAADGLGNIYVADNANSRIQKFTSAGVFLTKWGSFGSGNGQFNSPYFIAVDAGNNVYVADYGNDRIQKFTSNGAFLAKWGTTGSGNGQMHGPSGIAVGPSGNVYITEFFNSRVQAFTSSGTFIATWGSFGSGDGQFNAPVGIDTDAAGNVYVVDSYNNRVQKFSSTGAFLTTWGSGGSANGEFLGPIGIAVHGTSIYVADGNTDRIQKFGPATWGQAGAVDTTFTPGTGPNGPVRAIALQPDGKVVIAGDFANVNGISLNRIARLNTNGTVDTAFSIGQGPNGIVQSLLTQNDGKILVGGWFTQWNGATRSHVARLNTDGSLDLTFDPGTGVSDDVVSAMAEQPDGKVLVAGNRVTLLETNGVVDASFASSIRAFGSVILALAVQEDGRILAAGLLLSHQGTNIGGVARLHPDGTLDTVFQADMTGASAVLLTADGKVLVGGGFFAPGIGSYNGVARFDPDGSLDSSFTFASFGSVHVGASAGARALALQADGKIMVAGDFGNVNGITRYGIARLLSNGRLDHEFDPGGSVSSAPSISAIASQPDGRVIIGGSFISIGGIPRNNIARLQGDGTNFPGRFEFNVGGYRISEGVGSFLVPVLRSGGTAGAVSVRFSVDPSPDLVPQSGTLTFAPGQASNSFSVSIFDDSVLEGEGLTNIRLSSPTGGAVLGSHRSVALVITDNDTALEFGAPSYSALEAGGLAAVSVVRSGYLSNSVSIELATSNLTATAGLDYVGQTNTLTFASGETNKTVLISLLSDREPEPVETFQVLLRNPGGGAVIGSRSSATVRMIDDTPGALDAGFNPGATPFGSSVVVQGDGKVILCGSFFGLGPGIMRLNGDGSLDNTFSLSNGLSGTFVAAALQADGKLIVGGRDFTFQFANRRSVARFLEDGSVDTAFIPPTINAIESVRALALQADGKILVGSANTSFGGPPINIFRFNANGSVDANFNPGGGANAAVQALAVQPDGKILLGGAFTSFNGITRNYLARLNADGSLDPGFDPGNSLQAPVNAVALLPDGRVFAGSDYRRPDNSINPRPIGRFNTDGTLDAGFVSTNVSGDVRALAVQAGGKVFVGGGLGTLVRLTTNGLVDATFNPSEGMPPVFNSLTVQAISLQADGKVLIAGSGNINGFAINGVARFNNDAESAAGRLEFTAPIYSGSETDPSVTVALRRIGGSNGVVLVNFATIADSASADADYASRSGTLTFPAGDTSEKFITIQLHDDTLGEGNETFFVNLANPIGGTVLGLPGVAQVSIVEDDTVLQFAQANFTANERVGIYPVLIRRLGKSVGTVTTHCATADGTAQAGLDYVSEPCTLTFADGETNKTILISIFDDPMVESNETVHLSLSDPTGAVVGTNATAVLTIVDNDRPGTLDTTFDPTMGAPSEDDIGGFGLIRSILVQPDGRVLIAGSFEDPDLGGFGIARLMPDGALDFSFSVGQVEAAAAIALQADGKVLVGVGDFPRGLLRLNDDGSVDQSFNTRINGEAVSALMVQPDGRIIIGGRFSEVNGTSRNSIARLNPNGSLDGSFDPGSGVMTDEFSVGEVRAIALQADGRIILGGRFSTVNGVANRGIARLNTDGSPDATFDPGGGLTDPEDARATVIVVQPDGRVLVGGRFTQINGVERTSLARLHVDGSLDAGFVPRMVEGTFFDLPVVLALALQPDNKVLAGGFGFISNGVLRNGIARLNADGSLDAGFEAALATEFEDEHTSVRALALQGDGQVLIGGRFDLIDGLPRSGLARLNGGASRFEFHSVERLASGRVRLRFAMPRGQTHLLQASDDFQNWTVLNPDRPLRDSTELTDAATAGVPHRFYRAVQLP